MIGSQQNPNNLRISNTSVNLNLMGGDFYAQFERAY